MPGWKEISEFVLKYDYCCGCGVCTGVCPQNALEMRFNEYGEYKPYLRGNCTACGLCSRVCPFVNGNPNEDEIGRAKFRNIEGIKHTPETGYYRDSYIGYAADPQVRWSGASGGLTTWLLCMLLETRRVDGVITVAPTGVGDKLFEYRILDDPLEVRKCAKSVYYPVELSIVLRHIGSSNKRFALVGLPCMIKATQLAAMSLPAIRERIVYTVALTCGHLNSAVLVDYLLRLKGISAHAVRRVSFREKEIHKPSHVYLFKAFGEQGELCKVYWHEGYAKAFLHEYFKINACGYCDDIVGECADISLMDAWMEPYRSGEEGCNLIVARSPELSALLGEIGSPAVRRISIGDVVISLRNSVRKKRTDLATRLCLRGHRSACIPMKRVTACSWMSTLNRRGMYVRIRDKWRRAARGVFRMDESHAPPIRQCWRRFVMRSAWAFPLHFGLRAYERLLTRRPSR
jgi:coenzyme F420 hydrogenase subunit beta